MYLMRVVVLLIAAFDAISAYKDVATGDNVNYQFFPISGNELRFRVRAQNDAHIALTMQSKESDPMYEIVIGGWSNTKSVIRRKFTSNPDKYAMQTPQYLSGDKFNGFWIRWDMGIITVGREGFSSPFLAWIDPNPFFVAFAGVHTGYGSNGFWKFDTIATGVSALQYQFFPVTGNSVQFKVRARNDAHIALASYPKEANPMYEIVIGGWSNTRSIIRRRFATQPDKIAVQTMNYLNEDQFRGFWVRWEKGVVTVGREAECSPFLRWHDPQPFSIAYVGVHTGYGSSGLWYFQNTNNGQNNSMSRKYEVTTEDNTIYQFFPSSSTSLRLKVRARNDAHIALATHPWESAPMYEIVIGGWANSKSIIRRRFTNQPDKVAVQTAKFLNEQEFREFWVRWDNGVVSVGRDKESTHFLSWHDPEPFSISAVGVHTGYGANGDWKIET